MAKSVKAHGRFTARLKSSVTEPSAAGAPTGSERFAAYVVTPLVSSVNRMLKPPSLPLNAVSVCDSPSRENRTTPGAV